MLRIILTFFFLSTTFLGSSQSADPSGQVSEPTVLSGVQAWEVERSNTFILGQRRRASGSILAAIGAGVASIGAVGLVIPLVALGGALSLIGGIQIVSGSVLVINATDIPPDVVQLPQPDLTGSRSLKEGPAERWKPILGEKIYFDLEGEAVSGRVMKSNLDATQFRVEFSQGGKLKRKWMFRRDIRKTAQKQGE